MKTNNMFSITTLCVYLMFSSLSGADMPYYVPFENSNGNPDLENNGTAGGMLSPVSGPYGGTAPGAPANTHVAPNIGSTYSELFEQAGTSTSAGALLLPDSTSSFRLDSASSGMTLSTWIYWNGSKFSDNSNYTTYGIANTRTSPDGNGWTLFISNGGELSFSYKNSTGSATRRTPIDTIIENNWYNIVMTWDSTSTDFALAFYVNGERIGNANINAGGYTGTGILVPSDASVALGAYNSVEGNGSTGGGYGSLNGYMDDFALWDTVLEEGKLLAIYTTPEAIVGYNAGNMNSLFNAFDNEATSVSIVGSNIVWSYTDSIVTLGHELGDTWLNEDDGNYYIWLDGDIQMAVGMVGMIPEQGATSLVIGLMAVFAAAMSCHFRKWCSHS